MALLKTLTNIKGITTKYHKIQELTINKIIIKEKDVEPVDKYSIDVLIYSYVSEDIRISSERLAAERMHITLEATTDEVNSNPIFKVAYRKLKEKDTFNNAIDC